MDWTFDLQAAIGWLATLVLMGGFGYLLQRLWRKESARQLREREEHLQQTLKLHGVGHVQTLKDRSTRGSRTTSGHTPYQVHLILHSPPNRWFVYIHIEGSNPVLTPLTEQRARLAANA